MLKEVTESFVEEGECVMIGIEIEIETEKEIGNGKENENVTESGREDARETRSVSGKTIGGTDSTCDGLRWNVGQVVMLTQTGDGNIQHGIRVTGSS